MKKLIFTLIICIGLITIGCENSLSSRENFNTNTSSEINDNENLAGSDNDLSSSDNQSGSTQNTVKEKIDISSEEVIISSVLYNMYQENIDYDTAVNSTYLPNTAYMVLNTYVGGDYFIMSNNGYCIARDDANQYIKVISSKFNGARLNDPINDFSNLLYYSESEDMYYITPADGAPWISIEVLDAYDNNDKTYTAIVDAYFESNGGDHDYIGQYKVSLVDNDSTSKFNYRISNIEYIN